MTMIEDRILVWRVNRGDLAALCRIYEKYRDDLLRVAAVRSMTAPAWRTSATMCS
jgi:hypothetical protein